MDSLSIASALLVAVVLFSIAAAWVTGRTAKSKGYSYGWFFTFSLLSWYITAVITVFLKPRFDKSAKPKISSAIYVIAGTLVEFTGLGMLPNVDPNASPEVQLAEFTSQSALGAIAVAVAGALIVLAGVSNDRRAAAQPVGAN
jgi:cytochrome bd-type quinol oxidase subunit 2